jgi:hypothetical protein
MMSILHLSLYLLWRGSMDTDGPTNSTYDHRDRQPSPMVRLYLPMTTNGDWW